MTKTPTAKLTRLPTETGTAPAMLTIAKAFKGNKFTATLPNGVTYSGIVADVLDRDGVNLVTFRDGITPKK